MMKSILYVTLPAHADGALQIAQERGDRIELINHRGPFGSVDCVAFAPATAIGHFRAPVPARNEAEAARAALYAIEDELAQPVEEVHLVLGPRLKDTLERDIYIVDQALMKSWLNLLSKAGLSPAKILPEQSLYTDISIPVDMGSHILQREGARIIAIDSGMPAQAREALADADAANSLQDSVQIIRLAERSSSHSGVNLRTGPFALPREKKQGISVWRKAAGIGVAAVSVWTGTLILEARNYNYAAGQLGKRAAERYAVIFPDAAIPSDIDRATRDMLAVTATPDTIDFRTSSAALFEAITISPGTYISSLTFDGNAGRLIADVEAPSPELVSGIITFLQNRGFKVSSNAPEQSAGNTTSQIILEPMP
ncbi:MAG: type II secretion system protein GspL [Hyphomonas sp. 34-62-18]|nr:type II secretion system protein GspL [Hyphomonas sp. 34-62-18]OZB16089.1 MAG: type II secretion system protein GspL [Hyphomonas sp. 34-62-18]